MRNPFRNQQILWCRELRPINFIWQLASILLIIRDSWPLKSRPSVELTSQPAQGFANVAMSDRIRCKPKYNVYATTSELMIQLHILCHRHPAMGHDLGRYSSLVLCRTNTFGVPAKSSKMTLGKNSRINHDDNIDHDLRCHLLCAQTIVL